MKMESEYSESFIPRRVLIYKCSNYKGDTPTEIIFDKFTGILGETGAGKSSIIDAITFPIWKTTPRMKGNAVKIEDFCEIGGFCEVEFEKDHNLYVVRRGRKKNGSFVTLTINGTRYPETAPSKVDKEIEKIINMDYETFAMSGYIPQDEVKDILNRTNSERLNLLKNMFKLDVFDDALDITKERLKKVENEITSMESALSENAKIVEKKPHLLSSIKEKKKEVVSIKEKLSSITNEISRHQSSLSKYSQSAEQYMILNERVSQLYISKNKISKDLDSYRKILEGYEKELEGLSRSKGSEKSEEELREKLEKLAELKSGERTLATYKRQYESIKSSYEKKKKEIGLKTDDYNEDGMELLLRFREDMSIEAEYVYNVIKNEGVKEIYTNLDREFEEQTKGIVEQINTLESKIYSLKGEIGKETEASLKSKIEEIRSIHEKQIDLKSKITSTTSLIEKYEKELKKIEEDLESAKKEMDLHAESFRKASEFTEKIEKLNDLYTKENGKLQMITGEIKQMTKQLQELINIEKRIKEMKEKLEKLKEKQTILEFIKKNVFHKRGMAVYVLRSILADIEMKASEIVTTLTYHREPAFKKDGTPNRMQKVSLIPDRYGLGIEVDGINVRRFSGGEKTIIAIALRIAIFQQLMEMSSLASSMRVLIIDEGDLRSLDDRTIDAFIQLLQSYESIFDRIILITHIDRAVEGFDQVIYVKKDPITGYSTISY